MQPWEGLGFLPQSGPGANPRGHQATETVQERRLPGRSRYKDTASIITKLVSMGGIQIFYETEKPDKTRLLEENRAYKTENPYFRRKIGNLNPEIWFYPVF